MQTHGDRTTDTLWMMGRSSNTLGGNFNKFIAEPVEIKEASSKGGVHSY